MGVKANQFSQFTEVHIDRDGADKLPGVSFGAFWKWAEENEVKHGEFLFKEIVDWDMAPMRKYLHAATIPAFVKKFNDTSKHETANHFHAAEVKDFLKVKFLGWNINHPEYEKWKKVLRLDKSPDDIFEFLQIQQLNKSIEHPFESMSTESLTPEAYNNFISQCEAYYYELFESMYDIRERPEL